MRQRWIEIVLLAIVLAFVPKVTRGQPAATAPAALPPSVNLADVQIQLTTGGGGRRLGRCTAWRIVVRGPGLVELHDLGTPPRAETKQRNIGSDTVTELVNQFLKVRFFEAPGYYGAVGSFVRQGDILVRFGAASGTGPWTELSLRLGPAAKTVRLHESIPAELQALRERVRQIGGPDAWTVK